MLAESLPNRPAILSVCLHQFRMLSYHPPAPKDQQIRSFGTALEPRYIVRAGLLDQ